MILAEEVDVVKGKQEIPLDLTPYAKQGLYFLNVKTAVGSYTQKLIVQ